MTSIKVTVIIEQDPKHPDGVQRSAVIVRRNEELTQSPWLIGDVARSLAPFIVERLKGLYPNESVLLHGNES